MTQWQWLSFAQLSNSDLYAALGLRQQVFILEQQCLYPDIDGYDAGAHHLLCWQGTAEQRHLAAYLRCIPPGVKFPEMALGRVVTAPAARAGGLGRQLMELGIGHAELQHPGQHIRIGAQQHLEKFYNSLGFQTISAPYDEDGILHIDMRR